MTNLVQKIKAKVRKIIEKTQDNLLSLSSRPWNKQIKIGIEVCGFCNLRCQMCIHPNQKREKGNMDYELFEKIVHEADENNYNIAWLHFLGEPLMWPHIVKGIKLLSDHGMKPLISTNGMLFTKETAIDLEKAGLKEIMVTIDTLIPEAYIQLRRGGNLETVKKNIHDALTATNILVRAQLMPSKFNPNETAEDFYAEFGHTTNFKVEPWFVIRMNDSENVSQNLTHCSCEVDKRICRKPYDLVWILWDGRTVLCCLDGEAELVTGNIRTNSIKYSWMGPQIMKMRKKILKGDWTGLDLCKRCPADHILMHQNERWKLTSPPSPLPLLEKKRLKVIENLGIYDEQNNVWSKKSK